MDAEAAITSPDLPGAIFHTDAACDAFADDAVAYEQAVAAFEKYRDEALLHVDLAALGFDDAEIQRHVERPGWRMAQAYG